MSGREKFLAAQSRAAKYGFHHSSGPEASAYLAKETAALAARQKEARSRPRPPPAPVPLSGPGAAPAPNALMLRQRFRESGGAAKRSGGGFLASIPDMRLPFPLPQLLLLGVPVLILQLSYLFPYPVVGADGYIVQPSKNEILWLVVAVVGWFHNIFGLPDGWTLFGRFAGFTVEKSDSEKLDEALAELARERGGAPVVFAAAPAPAPPAAAPQVAEVSPSTSTASDETAVAAPEHPLLAEVPPMVNEFLRLATDTDESQWDSVANVNESGVEIKVWKYKKGEWCFKVMYDLPTPIGVTLDTSADISSRVNWDEMVDAVDILEVLDRMTRIEYLRAKPVWPTAARDVVLLSHLAPYPSDFSGEGEPQGFLHVTKSVQHSRAPNPKGVVRMTTSVAGRIFTRLPNGGTRSLQIADLNPGGSVPGWVVNFVAGKAVPKSVGTMFSVMKKAGWKEDDGSRLWREGLAGPGWKPKARVPAAALPAKITEVEDAMDAAPAARVAHAVEAEQAGEERKSEAIELRPAAAAAGSSGSSFLTVLQTVHDVLEWSTPFLVAGVAVAVAIGAGRGGIRVEVGRRR
ncbi:hypothetical protein DFJ74DRAFT_120200 [Hyaloraphidium curvatum]|nr:hypothetical protein DFJ74DRAFT_120200 [Hyaloraphidium curvatum]